MKNFIMKTVVLMAISAFAIAGIAMTVEGSVAMIIVGSLMVVFGLSIFGEYSARRGYRRGYKAAMKDLKSGTEREQEAN